MIPLALFDLCRLLALGAVKTASPPSAAAASPPNLRDASKSKPLRIAIRFPSYVPASLRERCLACLAAASQVEIASFSATTAPEQLDLIVDLSTRSIDPDQLHRVPRLGYWTVLYGEHPERIQPGLQEFLSGARAAYARLVRLEGPDSATILREGAVKRVAHSIKATRARLLEGIIDWPARVLRDQDQSRVPQSIHFRRRGPFGRLLLYAQFPYAWVRNIVKRVAQETLREHWAIGVIPQPVQEVCQSFDSAAIRWLPPPADGFLADPFGRSLPSGKLVIMAEALSWQDGRGRIVAFEAEPDSTPTVPREVFSFASHASYPQLIEYGGVTYCIPETCAQRRIQLFRADLFPWRWTPDTVLLEDFPGADATVHFHDHRWWMFTGNHDDQDETKLFVFHATALRGPWLPHAANPVKCDLRSSRPAGPLFYLGDQLCRPAQDCSATYGGAVVINRIEKLTPYEFVEHPIAHLHPQAQGPYPHGLHTFSAAGNVTLVDGKRHTWSAALLARRLVFSSLGRQ